MSLTLTRNLPPALRVGWTVADFERLFDAGFFAPDARLELIEGEIFETMTQRTPHSVAVMLSQDVFTRIFSKDFRVRVQLPMVLGESSKPEPDLAVVEGAPRDYLESHPSTAILAVEISDTTLVTDQTTKSSLYARAGIEEYWIVNLVERTLEVRRQPSARADALFGWDYRSMQILLPGESVAPLRAPSVSVGVDELLP